MTNILLRLFIKNCEDTQNPAVRSSIGKLAGLTGIVCNCLLTVLKLVIGLLVGSMAIIADGVNNLSDAASSLTTLLGFRMAQRPADKQHPYGHARYEYLSGLAVAALILLIGAELVKSSIAKIINPEPIDISAATIALLAASVAVKLWMSGFYKTLGKKINSTALYATSVDSRNDVISTCAVLLGCLVNYLFGLNIDGCVGLAVAIFILYSSVGIAKDTISPLLGQQADDELVDKITELVLSHEKVLGVHDLLVHDYGPGRCYASAHVELSADEDPMACHDIIDDRHRVRRAGKDERPLRHPLRPRRAERRGAERDAPDRRRDNPRAESGLLHSRLPHRARLGAVEACLRPRRPLLDDRKEKGD